MVGHILQQLRRRRLIPELSHVRYRLFLAGVAALKETDVLESVGIRNDSTLHLRAYILGGTPATAQSDPLADPTNATTSFNRKTGQFSSQHPDREHFQCTVSLALPR